MKKLSELKLNWNHMSPYKKGWIWSVFFPILLGIIMLSVSLGVLFGYVRPFEPWIYQHCYTRNLDYFIIDGNHEIIKYCVDGIIYEKILYGATYGKGVVFWYNANNPSEIIFAKNVLIVLLPILIVIGTIFIIFGFIVYFKDRKEYYKTDIYNFEQNGDRRE